MTASPLTLWTGILAAPLAWMVQLNVNFLLVEPMCRAGLSWPLHAVTAGTLLAALAGGALAWRAWRGAGGGWPGDGGDPVGRSRFMALSGLVMSAFFGVLILGQTIPTVILGPCR